MNGIPWAGRTVVVTGGLGFIGSHFVEELATLGAEVICLHRRERPETAAALSAVDGVRLARVDLRDSAEASAALRYSAPRIDAVFHCAALDGNSQYKALHPAEILEANLRMSLNVLGAARDHGVGTVVLLSSSEVHAVPRPRREDDAVLPGLSRNGYVLSKQFAEAGADLFRQEFGMDIVVARTTNVYGPRDDLDGAGRRVIPSMVRQVLSDGEVAIWGDGSQRRAFVYVTDLVRATLQMVAAHRYRTFAVGSGESVSIVELARTLFEVLGVPERIRLDPTKPVGVASEPVDLRPLAEVIDFTPRSLREGLDEMARWYGRHPVAP